MKTNNMSEASLVFLIIATVLISVSLMFFPFTSRGIELHIDVWFKMIMPIFILGLNSFILTKEWKKKSNKQKFFLSALLGFLALSAVYQTSDNWQYSSWGRASAFNTVDNFLTTMKAGDYKGATQYIKPCAQQQFDIGSLEDGRYTKPISWQLTEYTNYNSYATIIGSSKLADKSEVPIEFRITWNGLKWEVFSVVFGKFDNKTLQFSVDC